ncbi:MAG: ATP-binding protein [Candidatus Sericytochromatia bacterium]
MSAPRPHLLVVDDRADNRSLLVRLLEDDYEVSQAANGAEALEAIAANRPDLVLLDLAMPVLDGFGVLDRLKADTGRFLPVIVVTAASERADRLKALRLGAHEFLTKPIDGDEVLTRVANLLELQAAKEALRRHNERLEERVAERTDELSVANAAMRAQANALKAALADAIALGIDRARVTEALRVADVYKDEFLGVMSHELRTPLNFIMGFASVMEDEISGPLNATQLVQIGKILQGAERMLLLVDDLLDIASIQAGRIDLQPEPTPYGALVDETLASLAALADERQVALEADVAVPATPCVDGPRVVQIITNLVGNAIKFTPAGGSIRVRAFAQDDVLVTEVEDTGCGIPAHDLERVFVKFQQVDMSATRAAGGTGLGLAITRALVEAHGGQIEVTSELGRGTTFRFALPVRWAAS